VKEINDQLDALLLGGELKQNSMRTNMGISIARQLRDKLEVMTAERDELQSLIDEARLLLEGEVAVAERVEKQTASRCAEIAISYHIGSDSTSPARIAGAIRKEFNL